MPDPWPTLSSEADDEPWWTSFGYDAEHPPEWVEEYGYDDVDGEV